MMQFAYTILYVQDVKRSVDFYTKAFGFAKKFITPDNSYGEVVTGATTLSFAAITLAKSNLTDGFIESNLKNKPFGIEIGFTTDNVDGALQSAIDAGATMAAESKAKPWGQVVAYIRDPDGFLIEICTSMS